MKALMVQPARDTLVLGSFEGLLLEDPREGEQTEPLEKGAGKISNGVLRSSTGDPREGEETEPLERGSGKIGASAFSLSAGGPRPGEETEPLEEGDR